MTKYKLQVNKETSGRFQDTYVLFGIADDSRKYEEHEQARDIRRAFRACGSVDHDFVTGKPTNVLKWNGQEGTITLAATEHRRIISALKNIKDLRNMSSEDLVEAVGWLESAEKIEE